MSAAAHLYVGRTTHARLSPFTHRFSYRIANLSLDVDRLAEAARQAAFFSVDAFNLFSFHVRDHGARDGSSLSAWARARLKDAGVELDGGPVRLISLPRVLGYVFNPISYWFGYGPAGDLRGVIYEVNNTFGDTHAYVAPTPPGVGPLRHSAAKLLHVSPFFDRRGEYDFRLSPPDDRFSIVIRYRQNDVDQFVAAQTAERRALTDASLLKVFFGQPLMTLKVIGGIHLEAAKLWRKGARYRSRPAALEAASVAASTPESDKSHVRLEA